MKVKIKGVEITLTTEQEREIARVNKRWAREVSSLATVLRSFGFKKHTVTGEEGSVSSFYTHVKNGWHAEIEKEKYYTHVWIVGNGLKDSGSFPGGWYYGEPQEITDELNRALEAIKK